VSAIKRQFFKHHKASFCSWVVVIEDWVIEDWVIAVLPIRFRNITSQVPDPGGIVIIQAQGCSCIPDSNCAHIPAVAGEQDFFLNPKGVVGMVEVRRGYST